MRKQEHDLRTKLSPQPLHAEEFTTTESRIRWTTASALDMIGSGKSNIESCSKNLELPNQLLEKILISFDEEKQN